MKIKILRQYIYLPIFIINSSVVFLYSYFIQNFRLKYLISFTYNIFLQGLQGKDSSSRVNNKTINKATNGASVSASISVKASDKILINSKIKLATYYF